MWGSVGAWFSGRWWNEPARGYIHEVKRRLKARTWRARFGEPSLRKRLLKLRLVPRWLTSADFRLAFTSGVSANSVCFERELLDHHRLVFEKPTMGAAGLEPATPTV